MRELKLSVLSRPAVPPAVSNPDVVASVSEDEAQAAVGQVDNPAASLQKEAMLQEDCGLWSWRKKSHFGWPLSKLAVHIQVKSRKESKQ